jgi:alpha-D-ribose 1-methylphosphonate 5-triphosphate diphosphatase PhnM
MLVLEAGGLAIMTLAITNGTIIDGRGGDPLTGRTLLLEDERIAAIASNEQLRLPRGTTIIDAGGGSILPGLIDCGAPRRERRGAPTHGRKWYDAHAIHPGKHIRRRPSYILAACDIR